MILRPATIEDSGLLLSWRNDPITRAMSHTTHVISRDEHVRWLRKTIADKKRCIYIAEIDGVPIGTIRADRSPNGVELSWTIAPEHRGKGLGKQMVCLLVSRLTGHIYASVKTDNVASLKIAKAAGVHVV